MQARILEWGTISFSRGAPWPRDQTHIAWISCIGWQILYHGTIWGFALAFLSSSLHCFLLLSVCVLSASSCQLACFCPFFPALESSRVSLTLNGNSSTLRQILGKNIISDNNMRDLTWLQSFDTRFQTPACICNKHHKCLFPATLICWSLDD